MRVRDTEVEMRRWTDMGRDAFFAELDGCRSFVEANAALAQGDETAFREAVETHPGQIFVIVRKRGELPCRVYGELMVCGRSVRVTTITGTVTRPFAITELHAIAFADRVPETPRASVAA